MGYATAASHLSHRSRPRYIDPNAHMMSSAQTPWSGGQPVTIQHSKPFDGQEAAKRLHRRLNLSLLKKEIYQDDTALLALAAEVSPERMQDLLASGAGSEMAEHIEQTIGLPAGWLDCRRDALSSLETAMLRASAHAQNKTKAEGQEDQDKTIKETSQQTRATQAKGEDEQAPLFSPSLFPDMNAEPESQPKAESAEDVRTSSDELTWQGWLQGIIKQHPRGTSSRIAQHMGRGPSELSGWLTQQRGMPVRLNEALVAGCQAILGAEVAEQLRIRLHCEGESVTTKVTKAQKTACDATSADEASALAPVNSSLEHPLHPLQAQATPTMDRSRQHAENRAREIERDLAALRTAEKLADFLAALGQRTRPH